MSNSTQDKDVTTKLGYLEPIAKVCGTTSYVAVIFSKLLVTSSQIRSCWRREMCKHCKKVAIQSKGIPPVILYEEAEGEWGDHFRIGRSISKTESDYWFFGETNAHDIEIYYCPFCGRKLEEE